MKDLEKKLNKEYEKIGVISICEMHEDKVLLSEIDYVSSIMNSILPLKNDERIIVAKKRWEYKYTLIDGYHRLKHKIENGVTDVDVIILDKYKINRKDDTLFDFLSSLVGSTIKFLSSEIIIVDGSYYEIESNEGCGGCANGWSSLDIHKDYLNKNIKIRTIESKQTSEDVYDLYINGEKIATVDTGYGNGYYGGDFKVYLRN